MSEASEAASACIPVPAEPGTSITLAKSDLNLVWLDCEMTGLQPDTDRIIEIAVVVTSPDLAIRIEGPVFAIHQADALLDGMDEDFRTLDQAGKKGR